MTRDRRKAPVFLPPDPSTDYAGSGGRGFGRVPLPTEYGGYGMNMLNMDICHGQDHAKYADFVGYGEFNRSRAFRQAKFEG